MKQITLPFILLLLTACTVGPNERRPSSADASAFKKIKDWKTTQPSPAQLPSN